MEIEKTLVYNQLFDIYESLLTPKQREVFKFYYHDDLSYHEIAEYLEISRAGVYDNLSRTLKILNEYEEKLGLLDLLSHLQALDSARVNHLLEQYLRRKL